MVKTAGYILYSLGSSLFFLLVKILAPFHQRAHALNKGQKNLLKEIAAQESHFFQNTIWFHVSSLGEFEQGRPVMEALKKKYPQHRLVVTFFSPSGYEHRKNDSLIDAVYFLPFESRMNAIDLLDILKPVMAFWVKYDFWYCYLRELKKRKIPVFLLAAQFRPEQIFFQPYGLFKRDLLKLFTFIFCQNDRSSELLEKAGIHNHLVSGDNRFDRVYQNMLHQEDLPYVQEFLNGGFTLIAGSSYEEEEAMIAEALKQNPTSLKVIIAPHFVFKERIDAIKKRFEGNILTYSQIKSQDDLNECQVLLIDSIGLLSRLYHYGHAAIIGGGFKENGLHNCLEAAAFGMPISFGPKIKRFPEAQEMVKQGIAFTLNDKTTFAEWIKTLMNQAEETERIAAKSKEFVAHEKGATEKVMNKVSELVS